MKGFFVLAASFILCNVSNAQLVIYSNLNLQGSSSTCVARTIYTDGSVAGTSNIPNSLNNGTKSICLSQGYMATLAENADGSGEGFSYMATVSNLTVNLSLALQNKVSFIRVLPLPSTPVKKKGAGSKEDIANNFNTNTERDALNVTWWYDWGLNDLSTSTQEFSPMMWGAYSSIETSVNTVANKTNVTHFLSFNEPDSRGQSGGSGGGMADVASYALPFYKKMLRSGMRMGSPAPTENQYRVWLKNFTDTAALQKLRVDYVATHWYDWGNVCTNFTGCDLNMPIAGKTVSMDANAIFTRFKSWVNAVYDLHQKPVWITEFHAHLLRPAAVQEAFMNLALPWLDANPDVERYAYFFGNDVLSRNANGSLTGPGQVYSSHPSVNVHQGNIYDKRPASASTLLASWQTSGQTQGGRSVANFAPTYLLSGMTVPTALARGSGVDLPTTTASDGYWGGNDWSTTTADAGESANRFITFSVRSNQEASYHSINKFNIRISATGPIKYQIEYKIGSGRYGLCTTLSVERPVAPATAANFTLGPIDISGIERLQDVPANQTVTFRITPFEATSATGSFLIGDGTALTNENEDLSVTGSFSENLILPITLSKFQSNRVKDKVFLNWETQSEVNFSHFILERSIDGKTFYNIAKINSLNQSGVSKYNHTDTPEAATIIYYRLKSVDIDGSFAYSKILSESFDAADVPFSVYPSIATGDKIETTFKKVSEAAQIKVFNANGQLISTHNLQAGASTQSIEIAHFTEGVYFLILHDKGTIQSRKFIKQ